MILVDTSVWVDYFNGFHNWQTDYLHDALGSEIVVMGDLILMEVLQGFRSQRDFLAAKEHLSVLECHSLCSWALALQGAEHYRFLRRKGITVSKTMDVLIGTWCIANSISLLHNDRDFDPMVEHLALSVITS